MNESFYRFRAEAGEEPASAELLIFAAIGDWEDLGEMSARMFAADLAKLPSSVRRLDIHINSPGGSVAEANGIYSRLADHRSEKIVYIDGLAASAASIVAMVGHKIYIRANANMMIHLPSGIAMGDADEMRKMAAALDSVTESMINVYAKRTKLPRDEVRSLMSAETWFSPQEAIEKGFADEMRGVVKAAASLGDHRYIFNGVTHDLSRFHNVPAFTAQTPTQERNQMSKKEKATAAAEDPPKDDDNGNGNGEGNGNGDEGKGKEKEAAPPTPPASNPAAGATNEFDRGVRAERDRIQALQELDRPATHEIVMTAIKDGKQPTDIIGACMKAMDTANAAASARSARHTDASVLSGIPPSDGAAENGDGGNEFGAVLKKKVAARLKARGSRMRVSSRN